MKTMTDARTRHYGAKLSAFLRVSLVALGALALLAIVAPANAQTEPSVTFGASVTSGAGSLSPKLTWSSAPAGATCAASGHPSWTGTKASSGTLDLPPITLSGTYTLSLSCTWPGDTSALLKWIAPTTNSDGTPLAKCASGTSTGPCLAGFNVYRRMGSADMNGGEMTPLRDPNQTSYTRTGLGAGVHYFALEAVNGDGVPSPMMSNVASKTISGSGVTKSAPVTLTVNPQPGNVSGLTVQ